ncbi:multidrug resistance-associated protein 1-like isoform X2 [Mizuhopecten yessoensis]|uniref:ABC-type glutathione-S-conjugate transporter n=1 Tax=Mizuhopecten yessoensis TaxID=6573 RepID=A0A210QIM0_MIZYE|nr:multidrug resistance-associated protein 1-like isoform X2 [Mizuhopecten yessoensis]OWF48638.1 Multidrug resistance-associated protein 1 [Mizuhopecten yessoensis]
MDINDTRDFMSDFCNGSSIWNASELIDGSFPEFSECFQQTLLVWIPCGVLLLAFPFYLSYLYREFNKLIVTNPCCCFHITKLLVNVLLTCVVLIELIYQIKTQEDPPLAVIIASTLKILAFMVSCLLTHILRIKGVHTSGLLFVFWLLMAIAGIIPTYTKLINEEYNTNLFTFVPFFCYYFLVLLQLFLHCFAEHKLFILDDEEKERCPEGSVSILNQLYFWWMNGLVIKAFKSPLEPEDLWSLNPWDKSQVLHPKLDKAWKKEVTKSLHYEGLTSSSGSSNSSSSQFNNRSFTSTITEKTPLLTEVPTESDIKASEVKNGKKPDVPKYKPSLFRALLKTFGPTYCCAILFKSVSDILQFINPVLLQFIINYADNRDSLPLWRGYVPALLMLFVALIQSLFYHQNFKIGMTVGMRIRSALISAIYKKEMTMSNEMHKNTTLGETVNLMSVDCQRIQDTFSYLWSLVTVPLQTAIGIYLLWTYVELGPSCLAGLAVLMLMVPLNSFVAIQQRKLQGLVLMYKGKRIKLFSEILNGIKVLKMYAWEPSFTKQVLEIRQQELKRLKHIAYLQGFTTFCFLLAPFVVMLATFATYVVTSETHSLRSDQAFVALALFNILRVPVNLLSQLISYGVQAMVSINRIRNYLSGTDLDPNNVHFTDSNDYAVEVNHGTFIWDRDMPQPTLKDINFHIPDGHLVAVVGQVGAGKSSLISSLLGDLTRHQGNVTVKGKVAYVPQEAWIQNATLMDNILFGKQLLAKKYKKVIEACGLGPDLEMLPGGDQIEIGEKGINISGGQKQRISLGRAVYSNSNVYLMDDPLSAVDAHVGKHIFTKVIGPKGLLKNKTRILVTHGIQWLPMVDNILVMTNGRISEFGSYEDLISHDGPFAQFLKEFFLEDEEEDAQVDPELRAIKDKIFEQVEAVTSEGLTSDDQRSLPLNLRRASVSRRGSRLVKRKESVRKPPVDTKQQLIQQETAKVGGVKIEVFKSYFGAAGWWSVAVILVLFAGFHTTSIYSNFWLTFWTEDRLLLNISLMDTLEYRDRSYDYLLVYGLLGVIQAVLVLIYGLMLAVRMVIAAGKLHEKMLYTIMRCPMAFFDTTPIGRIINRFSSDVDIMDNNLPITCRISLNTFFLSLSTVIVISVNTPLFLLIIIPVAVLYFIILKFYIPTSRQLKRLESMTRSPVYNHFSESVSGASVIRAYRAQDRFIKESMDRVDNNLVFYYGYFVSSRWLGVRLEFLGNFLILAATLFGVFTPGQSGAIVGLSISYALQATSVLNVLVVNISDLQSNTVSVERIKEYSEVQAEAEWYGKNPPHPEWPRQGEIIFQNYKTRYRPDLDLVLKGITIHIHHGEKIGIVGRTGAGKSSLTLSLFRLIEGTEGNIIIDGVRIADIGLHNLREKLTILPQDPVLFSGTLRMNLDPFDKYKDDQLWNALQQAHLSEFVKTLPGLLSYQCGEGGHNFSVGQRQLVCLARTLLKKTNVLILDEATAAVDMQTDALIQETIHSEFHDCTVLSIAHRLNTVLDYDKVLVLSNGDIAEFDSPSVLLGNHDSIFYGMAVDAGLVSGFQNG